jgi:cytidyltransferase-like protein
MRLILAHGCFDILHVGHHWHLKEARSFGDRLVVSITASEFVNKGPGLPVFSNEERAEQIANLRFVDEVYICHAPYAEPAIRKFRPAYYVKGIDYIGEQMVPNDMAACKELGVGLIFTATKKYGSGALCKRLHQ